MSIRWKLLVILLIFSITPLLVYFALNQRVVRQLQDTFSEKTIALLTRIMENDLQQTARDYAQILGLEMYAMEMGLKNLARDAERSSIENSTATSQIFFTDDFNNLHRAPDDLIPSSKFMRHLTPTENIPIAVSLEHQVFILPPDIDRQPLEMDIVRLSRLIGVHQELEHDFGERIYWQYVRMASGIQTIYPGHGSAAQRFTVGNESWFQLTKERGRLGWSNPHIDAVSGQLVITVSTPLRRPDGSFLGVAAIDLPILKVLQMNVPPSQWKRYTHFYLVRSGGKNTSGKLGFQILAKQDSIILARWVGSSNLEYLASSDHQKMRHFFNDFQVNNFGLTRMPFDKENSIWAYAHIDRNISLLLIVPEKTINLQTTRTHKRMIRWLMLDTLASAAVVVVILIVIAFSRSGGLVSPLLIMVQAVQQLAKGDFSTRMDYNTGDERDLVASAFNKMVPQLEDRMRMHRALNIAQKVQQTLLPDEIPNFPGFEIAGKVVYCDETGGDYFDLLPYKMGGHNQLGVVVGDVSDHGIGAALLMATARAFIRSLSDKPGDLAQRITRVNRLFSADVRRSGNFMTLFYLELTAESPTIRWVRAGNEPAILFNTTTGCIEELVGPGMVLGVDEDYIYKHSERIILPQETIILIGTDGIWDTQNSEGEMFGKQRLVEILKSVAHETAKEIQNRVLKTLDSFRGDMTQEDDVTIVIIKSI